MEKTVTKKAAAKKSANKSAGKTLVVVQMRSHFGTKPGMLETLKGLGLGKRGARKELMDTPAVQGMLFKVRHLIAVETK